MLGDFEQTRRQITRRLDEIEAQLGVAVTIFSMVDPNFKFSDDFHDGITVTATFL